MIAGDMGRVLVTRDGGLTWETQPTITSSPLFAVAYHGGANAWVAGRGGAILRRTEALATVKFPTSKSAPALRGGAPKLKGQDSGEQKDPGDDIPRAVPRDKKPVKP